MPLSFTAKKYRFACIVALFSANLAMAQVQQSALTASLKGVEATGIVTIGDSGIPAGLAANNALPVNTLVYPDGQIIYRVEFGLVRGEVVQMQKSFGNGTVFQVNSVDFKDDRLELKLVARNRDSGRLKLMLGPGWQARMSNQDVISVIMKFLSLPVAPPSSNSPNVAIASSAPNSVPPLVSKVPAPSPYQRPATAAVIMGRPSDADTHATFTEFQREKGVAEDNVVRTSQPLSQALRAFKSVFSDPRQRAQGMIQPIIDLQARIGPELIPRTPDDVDAMDALFDRCMRIARMRSAGDQTGREYGPGSNSPAYLKAFLSRDAAG
jgi:hypothetical protein